MKRSLTVHNVTSGALVAGDVLRASDPLSRGLGLLPRAAVGPDEGLWIDGCRAVHTLGMRATLDLYFLDRAGVVLKIVCGVPPQRLSVSCRAASAVVELGAASAERAVRVGDRLVLR